MTEVPLTDHLGENADHPRDSEQSATVEAIFSDLTALTEDNHNTGTREEIQDIKLLLAEAHDRGLIASGVRELRPRDAAEALVGSVIFASPLLVEDGVFDIADHLLEFTIYEVPVFLIANTLFVVAMTFALIEWTGRNREETQVLFGIFPYRVIMALTISFVVAALLMTVWGRVGDWQTPTEAIARISVIWTVGSLGAALGDILSNSDSSGVVSKEIEPIRKEQHRGIDVDDGQRSANGPPKQVEELDDTELVDVLYHEFEELESIVGESASRLQVNRIREQTFQATLNDTFGDRIQKYTSRDIAEAFVGSVFFSIPFLVEDGVHDVADYFLSFQLGYFPVFFLVNTGFVILMILALVYWAGPQDVRMARPIFGFIPRRLVGISIVSFLTAAALMTMWGRVGGWQDPVVALARISVVWTVASFGAALGDILPGESSGADIKDDLASLGELTGEDSNDDSGPD